MELKCFMYECIKRCCLSKSEVYSSLYSKAHSGTYVSYIRGNRCQSETDLFYEISASFQFPWYFGENWPALDECLCDLDWLSFCGLFVVVDDFSATFEGNKCMQDQLIEQFLSMIQYWKTIVPIEVWLNN